MTKLHITLKRSVIGYDRKQRSIVKSLGLRRLNHTVVHEDSPTIRGMVAKIPHLVKVSEEKQL
jgi:large subunit ribosomal protein L30